MSRNELGGIVPFDQEICEKYIDKTSCLNFLARWINNINKLSDIVLHNRKVSVSVLFEFADLESVKKRHSQLLAENDSEWKSIIENRFT